MKANGLVSAEMRANLLSDIFQLLWCSERVLIGDEHSDACFSLAFRATCSILDELEREKEPAFKCYGGLEKT